MGTGDQRQEEDMTEEATVTKGRSTKQSHVKGAKARRGKEFQKRWQTASATEVRSKSRGSRWHYYTSELLNAVKSSVPVLQ